MAIFGISIFDNLGFEFIRNFIIDIKILTSDIIDYLRNTTFYKYFYKILIGKEIVKDIDTRKVEYPLDKNNKPGASKDIY
jgi:hypothetical protein